MAGVVALTRYNEAEITCPAQMLDRRTKDRPPGLPRAETEPTIAKLLKNFFFMVSGLIVAVVGLGVMNLNGFNLFQVNQMDRSQPALLTSVKDISQYHASVGTFQQVLQVEDDVPWVPDLLAGRQTTFIAVGTVNAYVDLAELAEDDLVLSPDGKSVKVRLPEPQLDKPNLDPELTYVIDQDRGALDRIADAVDLPEQSQYYQDAEAKIAAAAEESQLRNQAAENTEAMLTGMFGSLGIEATFLD
ncbi:DUF4230 domain-containing protein [Arthrobacter sp. MDT1-65]